MHQMIELHPKADALDVLGLPAIPYPVALPAFQAAVANDGELPLADMLHGLQLRAADPAARERLEPAMARLSELLAPGDEAVTARVRGADWELELGPLDPRAEAVALQRGDTLLAALADRGDGGLRLAAWRPLDAALITLLTGLARPARTGAAGETAWQRACATAAGEGTGFVRWAQGIGVDAAGKLDEALHAQAEAPPRRPACVAAEIDAWRQRRG